MSIDLTQFRDLIVKPVLNRLQIDDAGFCQLLICTAMAESNLKYLKQMPAGPAKGIYQMEDATHDDIWLNYLQYKPELARKIKSFLSDSSVESQIYGNLYYATAMCAAHYLRFVKTFPKKNDLAEMALIWKRYYNTHLGKGSEAEFIRKNQQVINI